MSTRSEVTSKVMREELVLVTRDGGMCSISCLHGCHLLLHAGGPPHLHETPHTHGHKGSIGTEFGHRDRALEGEAMEADTPCSIEEESSTIFVDAEEELAADT